MSSSNYLAYNEYPADGVSTEWDFNFSGVRPDSNSGTTPYLDPGDVHVEDVVVDEFGAVTVVVRDSVLVAPNRVRVEGDPIPVGHTVRIFRRTEARFPLVDYRDLQTVSAEDLDLQARQTLFVAAEAMDRASRSVIVTETAVEDIRGTANNALAVANGIDAKATQALSNSQSALATANGIDAKATQALSNSSQAVQASNLANTTANAAQATANGIDAKATQALATANAAAAAVEENDPRRFGVGAAAVSNILNLNDYLTAGSYITPSAGLLNKPQGWFNTRYIIEVQGGVAYAKQVLTDVGATKGRTATRVYDGSNWTAWVCEGAAYKQTFSGASAQTLVTGDALTQVVNLQQGNCVLSIALPVGEAPPVLKLQVLLVQSPNGGGTISHPAGTLQPFGEDVVAPSSVARSVTLLEYMSVDSGVSWMVRKLGVYVPAAPVGPMPAPVGMNETFNNEGVASAFTAVNMTVTETGGVLRGVKTTAASGGGGNADLTATVAVPSRDTITYVKFRSNTGWLFSLTNSTFTNGFGLWCNTLGSGVLEPGTTSLTGYNGSGANNVRMTTGEPTERWIEMALHWDQKFSMINCFSRRGDGGWEFRGRQPALGGSNVLMSFRSISGAPLGSYVEIDYVSVCRPNIVMVSDSIGEGKPGFSPNPALGLGNWTTTWMYNAPLFTNNRNNLVVNKGVGGNTSQQMLDRLSDYIGLGAQVFFLHASTNDTPSNASQAVRTANHQSIITAMRNDGGKVILLNAMYGTSFNSFNPTVRDYRVQWWNTGRLTLTGVDMSLDIMEPIRSADNYMRNDLTDGDGIHPNAAGHAAIGQYIKSFN